VAWINVFSPESVWSRELSLSWAVGFQHARPSTIAVGKSNKHPKAPPFLIAGSQESPLFPIYDGNFAREKREGYLAFRFTRVLAGFSVILGARPFQTAANHAYRTVQRLFALILC
jgi:hypothetical protein